jgi:hypothetical protein
VYSSEREFGDERNQKNEGPDLSGKREERK